MAEHSNQPSGLRGEFREKGSGKLALRSLNPGEFKATTKWTPKRVGICVSSRLPQTAAEREVLNSKGDLA